MTKILSGDLKGAPATRLILVSLLMSLWVSLLVFWPAQAWALCPNCLGQTRTLTPTLELIGAFLLLPFLVAFVVLRAIRRACRDLSHNN